jgi:hypothetical protein
VISSSFLADDVVERRVAFRRERQRKTLGRRPGLSIVLGAGALCMVVGSEKIMSEQAAHMRDMARSGAASIRVLPWTAGTFPMRGSSFALLDFAESGDDPPVAYLEFATGARYIERVDQIREYEHIWTILVDKSI